MIGPTEGESILWNLVAKVFEVDKLHLSYFFTFFRWIWRKYTLNVLLEFLQILLKFLSLSLLKALGVLDHGLPVKAILAKFSLELGQLIVKCYKVIVDPTF